MFFRMVRRHFFLFALMATVFLSGCELQSDESGKKTETPDDPENPNEEPSSVVGADRPAGRKDNPVIPPGPTEEEHPGEAPSTNDCELIIVEFPDPSGPPVCVPLYGVMPEPLWDIDYPVFPPVDSPVIALYGIVSEELWQDPEDE